MMLFLSLLIFCFQSRKMIFMGMFYWIDNSCSILGERIPELIIDVLQAFHRALKVRFSKDLAIENYEY